MRLTVLALILAAALGANAQSLSNLPRASEVVKPRAYVSLEPVPRGRAFEIAVVAQIAPGFHINANKVFEDYLVPTAIDAGASGAAGFRVIETVYPEGQFQKFDFSEKMLNVYDGSVTLRLKAQALTDARLGNASHTLTLRYQACNDRACLPPVRIPVPVEFVVADAGAKTKPANPEIFQKTKPSRKP